MTRTIGGIVAAVLAAGAFFSAVIWLLPVVRGTGDTATWFAIAVVIVSLLVEVGTARLAAGLLRAR